MTKHELVLIHWEDAFSPASCGWSDKDTVEEFIKDSQYICETVGFVLHEDERMLTLAMQRSNLPDGCKEDKERAHYHLQRIPKGVIIKRKKL